MKISEAMVLWNTSDNQRRTPTLPQIQVVPIGRDNTKFNYLCKSMGACWGAWRRAEPVSRATHLLSLFVKATAIDGVPVDQAQSEFLKIDEYREWCEHRTGPFHDAHVAWCSDEQEVA